MSLGSSFIQGIGQAASLIPGLSGIGGLISDIGGDVNNAVNYGNQQSNLAYQKGLQQTMFNREDDAVQRRVADMKKAGLNPILAAGNPAQAGPVVSTSAAQGQASLGSQGLSNQQTENQNNLLLLNALSAKANIAQTQAQTDLIKLQQNKVNADTLNTQATTRSTDLSNTKSAYDFGLNKQLGIGNQGGVVRDAANFVRNKLFPDSLNSVLKSTPPAEPYPGYNADHWAHPDLSDQQLKDYHFKGYYYSK